MESIPKIFLMFMGCKYISKLRATGLSNQGAIRKDGQVLERQAGSIFQKILEQNGCELKKKLKISAGIKSNISKPSSAI
jgi:hypothetical protein